MIARTEAEKAILREGGGRLARILRELARDVRPGVSTAALNDRAEALVRSLGDTASFLGYRPRGARRPFPAALCVSVNDEVVHGIPNEHPRTLREGDIVTLDMGLTHEGLITDAALSVPVGQIDERAAALLAATEEALSAGITAARAGKAVGDIGFAIESVIRSRGFFIIEELGGHSVGRAVHEEPFVPNFGNPGEGAMLKKGMVLAIEPIVGEGTGAVRIVSDGYTYVTSDGSRAAQYEHTILIRDGTPEILTA